MLVPKTFRRAYSPPMRCRHSKIQPPHVSTGFCDFSRDPRSPRSHSTCFDGEAQPDRNTHTMSSINHSISVVYRLPTFRPGTTEGRQSSAGRRRNQLSYVARRPSAGNLAGSPPHRGGQDGCSYTYSFSPHIVSRGQYLLSARCGRGQD